MGKIRTTVYLEDDTWKKLRMIALDKKISASKFLEEIIKEKMKTLKN